MSPAHTNQERFIAACYRDGEVAVRLKLNAARYSDRKTTWANDWLEHVESGKSDATKDQERSLGLISAERPHRARVALIALLLLVVALGMSTFFALA
jgi:hypothetical protein